MNKNSKIVTEAATSLNNKEESGLISLSSGVKLKPLTVPSMVYMEIMSKFDQPKVPRVMNHDLGREEENPSHPDYLRAMQNWQAEMTKGMIDIMVVYGTEIHSIPKGMEGPDGSKWVNRLKITGLSFDENNEYSRYLAWVKTVAAPLDTDIEEITLGVGRLSGVLEEDVQDATDQFRS